MGDGLNQLDPLTLDALRALGSVFEGMRRSRGMSQRRLAIRSGLSQSTISRLEAGKAPWLRAETLARLLAGIDQVIDEGQPRHREATGPPGWELLVRRFEFARRVRETEVIVHARRIEKTSVLLDAIAEREVARSPEISSET